MCDDVFHYRGLACWGPIGSERLDTLLELVPLQPGQNVLDVGCGHAELMVRLAERYGVGGVGVDRSAAALAEARAAFAERAPAVAVELLQSDAMAFDPGETRFDLVSWLGGPYLGDDYAATVATLARWSKPGGFLLIGHGYWRAPPPNPYLTATGMSRADFGDSWSNVAMAQAQGLRLIYTCSSNRDEWDAFEGRILYNVEQYALAHPESPDPQGRLAQRRRWNEAQLRWGREVMGFGCYLFRHPPSRAMQASTRGASEG